MKVEIEISNLHKAYGKLIVFNKFNCTLYSQKYNCITGPSGSGKTTLLRILMGLEDYDSGTISGIADKQFSCVFQENRLLESYTGLENIRIIANKKKKDDDFLKELDTVGLYSSANLPVYTYSGGMKRRLALVRAMIADYDIIVLDEPFKELDKNTYAKCLDYFEKRTIGKTVILSTHSRYEIDRFGDNQIDILDPEHNSF